MTTPVVPAIDLAESWFEAADLKNGDSPTVTKQYPKRSDLRRAEARNSGRPTSRRSADRRPAGGRPPGGSAGRHGPPAPASGVEAVRRGPHPASQLAPARLPVAIVPRPAVLPIRQTSDATRPAGISLRIKPQPAPDAFHQPLPSAPMVPIVVPATRATPELTVVRGGVPVPIAPPGLAAPTDLGLDLTEWGLDLDEPEPIQPELIQPATRAARRERTKTANRGSRRGRAGAARLLVLALVVGAEGLSVTALGGHARPVPVDSGAGGIRGAVQISSALSAAAALDDNAPLAAQPRLAAGARLSLVLTQAQEQASAAKATAALQQARAAAQRVQAAAQRRAEAMRNSQRDPQSVAKLLMADHGWGASQFSCLLPLWNKESRWNYRAYNPSSGAYGIPQALPGGKMASAGSDWRTNPVTQIRWGLNYIADRYGTPCGAWGHSEATGWY